MKDSLLKWNGDIKSNTGEKIVDKQIFVRACLIVGSTFLFIGPTTIPLIAQNAEQPLSPLEGNWFYVGGSGPGNFTKIQDAIQNASNGDTVYVYPNTYKEFIEINKSIHLKGADPPTTIIDGQGSNTNIITCIAPEVLLMGFTIYNCSDSHTCVFINHTTHCSVQDNIIHTAGYGIKARNAENISIRNNTLYQNLTTTAGYISIAIENCIFTTLSKNKIASWTGGVVLSGSHHILTQNFITNTHRAITDALDSLPYINRYLTITENHLTHNREGIHLAASREYSITQNEITNSTLVGIYIAEDYFLSIYPENIIIKENIIATSAQGIIAVNSINMTIEANHIKDNTLGVSIAYGSFISVKRNTFQSNNKTVTYVWALIPFSNIKMKVPQFDMNFWDHSQDAPCAIKGRWGLVEPSVFFDPFHIFPWIVFDWHPAETPYDF